MSHRYIISGGGTGGHIFPAIAIANEIMAREKDADILFVGANGRMEMEKVPAAGYKIIGLNISGIKRSLSLSNFLVPYKLFRSVIDAGRIIKKFKPDAVIGVGGYASSAVLLAASFKKIPALIQEQNSFPGITNKLLKNRVQTICVAYDGMERFFPSQKLVLTGNPVRQEITSNKRIRNESLDYFKLKQDAFTVLIIGGSLGARSINRAVAANLKRFGDLGIQIVWQTGSGYYAEAQKIVGESGLGTIQVFEFIREMDQAYSAADIVVSRAGAIAVSELCVVGKAAILVPYPHASEDHQTHNAAALADKQAAILIPDEKVLIELGDQVLKLYHDEPQRQSLADNISALARPDAAKNIVDEILKLTA